MGTQATIWYRHYFQKWIKRTRTAPDMLLELKPPQSPNFIFNFNTLKYLKNHLYFKVMAPKSII